MPNMTLRKGSYPSFSPDIILVRGFAGQYTLTATVTNSGATVASAQVLFYWAQAATPPGLSSVAPPQLYGWSLPAYVQPALDFFNPTLQTLPFASGQTATVSLLWVPDANVTNSINNSFDPAHIMIVAQAITVGVSAHPVDFNWFPPGTSSPWTAAAVFDWP